MPSGTFVKTNTFYDDEIKSYIGYYLMKKKPSQSELFVRFKQFLIFADKSNELISSDI